MSIKNILVAYNGSEGSLPAPRLAAVLAKHHDADIIGAVSATLVRHCPVPVLMSYTSGIGFYLMQIEKSVAFPGAYNHQRG